MLWQITEIANHGDNPEPLIRIITDENTQSSVLFIYTKDQRELFIKITSALEQQHLNIVAARISSSNDGFILDTLNILDSNNEVLKQQQDQLIATLQRNLSSTKFASDFHPHHAQRQLKHFDTPTKVGFEQDEKRRQTIITINTADQPGLLTLIGKVFIEHGLSIHTAKITTLGETAEDIFYVTKLKNSHKKNSQRMIQSKLEQKGIRSALIQKLQED